MIDCAEVPKVTSTREAVQTNLLDVIPLHDGDTTTIVVKSRDDGEIDIRLAPELHSHFADIELGRQKKIVVDLSYISYFDHSAVLVLVDFGKWVNERGIGLGIVIPQRGSITRTFEVVGKYCGFDSIITHVPEPTACA